MRAWHQLPLIGLLVFGGCAPTFRPERYIAHVAYLASDELGGRATGSAGIDLAAEYIAKQFKAAGLLPKGDNGTYFQSFDAPAGQDITDESALMVTGGPGAARRGRDFVPFPFSAPEEFEGPLAFAGYGITHPDADHDDYKDFNAEGKVLLMFRYEPRADDPKAAFGGDAPSTHSAFRTKASLARTHKAKAILIVNPPEGREAKDELFKFDSIDRPGSYRIPMMHVSREYANRMLAAAGKDDLAALQKSLDRERKPRSMDLEGLTAKGKPGIGRKQSQARNVVAEIRGSGPAADEYIVIGAHYDHVGRMLSRMPSESQPAGRRGPEIHNGADDNASGTAGVIEVARTFGIRGSTNRSVLFIAFAGEEIGLLGSQHFVNNPTVPVEKMVAMLNLDMVGRMNGRTVEVYGTASAEPFERALKQQSAWLGLKLKSGGGSFGGSDHSPFYNKRVPALHFFTGLHGDYHRPSDDTELINSEGGAKISHLVFNLAGALAAAPQRITFAEANQPERPKTGLKVRLGVMPSYADDDQPGMRVEGIAPGSPAEKAGLREGDRIVMIGDKEVDDVYGLMEAMGRYSPGDSADVTLLRDGERLKLGVKFEAP